MKAVILAGGLGTRISEESHLRAKPMIEIGGKPILWHILKIYSAHGINDFIICLGYKGYIIKELRAFPDEAITQVVLILQSVRKGICITQKAISKKSDPSGLCGIWKDNRSSGEIIEDIRSHRTGFGKRQIEF